MSYCRWSCDLYQSDLYVYESQRGWESHVAARRVNVEPPESLVRMPRGTTDELVLAWKAERKWVDSLRDESGLVPEEFWFDLREIGEEAGRSFLDDTPGECAARLRALRAKGFNVPKHALTALDEEAGGDS